MTVVVRHGTVADADAMGALHIAAWRAAYAGVMDATALASATSGERADAWREFFAGRAGAREATSRRAPTVLVAEAGGRLLAMSVVGDARERAAHMPTGELWMLNAHPDAFGSGAATALHTAALGELAAMGHAEAYLWVARDNARARRFYAREGWLDDGETRMTEIGGTDMQEERYVRGLTPPLP